MKDFFKKFAVIGWLGLVPFLLLIYVISFIWREVFGGYNYKQFLKANSWTAPDSIRYITEFSIFIILCLLCILGIISCRKFIRNQNVFNQKLFRQSLNIRILIWIGGCIVLFILNAILLKLNMNPE